MIKTGDILKSFYEFQKRREQTKLKKIEELGLKNDEVIVGTVWPAGDNTIRGIRILGRYRNRFDERTIEIAMDDEIYYYNLTDSFYDGCPEIRGAYKERNFRPRRDTNHLLDWLKTNGFDKGDQIEIIVVEPLKKYKLIK